MAWERFAHIFQANITLNRTLDEIAESPRENANYRQDCTVPPRRVEPDAEKDGRSNCRDHY